MEICLKHLLKICNYIYIKLYIYVHINFIYIYICICIKQRITAEQHYLYYWDKALQSWVLLITQLVLSHLKVTPYVSFCLSSFREPSCPWITLRHCLLSWQRAFSLKVMDFPHTSEKADPFTIRKSTSEDQISLLTPTNLPVKLPGV